MKVDMALILLTATYFELQEIWNSKASVERSFPDHNGNRIHHHGPGLARVLLHRLHPCWHLLRSQARHHSPYRIRTLWPQILRSRVQHSHPQPPPRVLPLLGSPRRLPLQCPGKSLRRREHLCGAAVLHVRVPDHGCRLHSRVRTRHLAGDQDKGRVFEDVGRA